MQECEIQTLEDFIENQCGMITPNLLHLLEPHREFVETNISSWKQAGGSPQWDQYVERLWQLLPEINKNHFEV